MTTQVQHHPFSPSRLDWYAECPYAYKNCLGWTEEKTFDATRGTLMHEAVYSDEALAKLTDADAETVRLVREKHVKPYLLMEHYFEYKVTVKSANGDVLTEGILDFLVISSDGKTAMVKDWKYGGQRVEEAERNRQIKTYSAGIFQMFPKVERIFAQIVQPAFGIDDFEHEAELWRAALPELIADVETIHSRAENATPEDANVCRNCQWCNRANCAKYRAKMTESMALLAVDPKAFTGDLQTLTLDYADRVLTAKAMIEDTMEERAEQAKKVILAAGGSENYKVAAGRVTRSVDWKSLAAAHEITEEEIETYTKTREGSPYLVKRQRKKKNYLENKTE